MKGKKTKYFLNLEKRHCRNGAISQLKLGENVFVTKDKEILSECEKFYKNLYKSTIDTRHLQTDGNFFGNFSEKTLDLDKKEKSEGPLTKTECLESLKSMAPDKSPGTDGIPAEFYKVLWRDIADDLLDAINYGFEKGQLSMSQRRGIIKLIPKKDAELNQVKNWRPITLLNCDYKIAAKAIANRVKKALPKLINNDQTGFMKGRFIGENISLIDSVIKFQRPKILRAYYSF